MKVNGIDITKYIYIICIVIIFVAGIYLRYAVYMDARPLWHDEAPVALNVMNNNIFSLLNNTLDKQKAPFLFWICVKFSGILFGYKELSLRIFPFVCSILSIFVFYIFSKKFLKNKIAIVIANVLFAINYQLLYFAQELKQYSSDILLFMVSILFFSGLANKSFDKKHTVYFLMFSIFIILSSFPACFVLAAFVIYKFFNLKKDEIKYFFISLVTVLTAALVYYYFFLYSLYTFELENEYNYWSVGFITIRNSLENFKKIYIYNFHNHTYILGYILFLAGFILILKERKKSGIILIISLFVVITASALSLYPLYHRVQTYLIPVFIVVILKIADQSRINSIPFLLGISLVMLHFAPLFNKIYIQEINVRNLFEKWNGREIIKLLKENYDKTDTIFVNYVSKNEFEYYSRYYNFYADAVYYYDFENKPKEEFEKFADNLISNKKYWFINIYTDLNNNENIYLVKWKENNKNLKIEHEYKIKKSYIIKIEKKY